MPGTTKAIVCAAVVDEIPPRLLQGIETEIIESGLHAEPDKLKTRLQAAIDATSQQVETILLGYGLCAQAVVGLRSGVHTLVIPRVDDCVALFIGSCALYRQHARSKPGSYFLSKGWIEERITPFHEYEQWVERYGERRARRIVHYLLSGYRRLALINTGQYDLEPYRAFARDIAERFSLELDEIPGSIRLIERWIGGDWDDDFLVIPPGKEVEYAAFLPMLLGEEFAAQSLRSSIEIHPPAA